MRPDLPARRARSDAPYHRNHLGLRWQGDSRDTAFRADESRPPVRVVILRTKAPAPLRFPPQSNLSPPHVVGQVFQPAGAGDFPVARPRLFWGMEVGRWGAGRSASRPGSQRGIRRVAVACSTPPGLALRCGRRPSTLRRNPGLETPGHRQTRMSALRTRLHRASGVRVRPHLGSQ